MSLKVYFMLTLFTKCRSCCAFWCGRWSLWVSCSEINILMVIAGLWLVCIVCLKLVSGICSLSNISLPLRHTHTHTHTHVCVHWLQFSNAVFHSWKNEIQCKNLVLYCSCHLWGLLEHQKCSNWLTCDCKLAIHLIVVSFTLTLFQGCRDFKLFKFHLDNVQG